MYIMLEFFISGYAEILFKHDLINQVIYRVTADKNFYKLDKGPQACCDLEVAKVLNLNSEELHNQTNLFAFDKITKH